jgi:transposase-like protein/ribosomal protein L37AE/L43A
VFFLVEEDFPSTLQEFEKRFGTEAACKEYLFSLRWPKGFVCPCCGHRTLWRMANGRYLCRMCRYQVSVTAGTIFQDSKLPLAVWFRAMWYITSQKTGTSALGLQRVLGLGSYRTAWAMLHKLRRAMVRPGRDRLGGVVEIDETYWGTKEKGVTGRLTEKKALIVVAAEEDGKGIGRIRLRRVPKLTTDTLQAFITASVETGSIVRTDGLPSYLGLRGYEHHRQIQRRQLDGEHLLPHVHRVISLLKRWLLGTLQGAVSHKHLDYYLDEFTFRFNRRKSASRGKLFFRLVQQSVQVAPVPYDSIVKPQPVVGG